jgi:hypothetical protein
MEKHEMFRDMSQELFDSFKYMYNVGHTGVFENIAKVVKYAIAGLLAYISYTQFDANTTISVLSGISAFCMAFRNRLISIVPSIIAAVKMTKKVTSSKKGADDLLKLLEKTSEALENDIVKKVQPYK